MVAVTHTCVPSDLVPYVYHFLNDNGFKKAAKYLKKEGNLNNLTSPSGPGLLEVFNSFTSQSDSQKSVSVDQGEIVQQSNNDTKKKSKKKRKLSTSDISESPVVKKSKVELDDEVTATAVIEENNNTINKKGKLRVYKKKGF